MRDRERTSIDRAIEDAGKEVFLGGPNDPELFLEAGRNQLMVLLSRGLRPDSKVLDVGCGALRGGIWLIRLLDPGCYFGIEPATDMTRTGIDHLLDPALVASKKPRFNDNDQFDFSAFDQRFDFVLARSIWTHATKDQIRTMLDGFKEYTTDRGVFLTSYLPKGRGREDYAGDTWVGLSHESDVGGWVHHSLEWIAEECHRRNLYLEEIQDEALNFRTQQWLGIHKVPPVKNPDATRSKRTLWERFLRRLR